MSDDAEVVPLRPHQDLTDDDRPLRSAPRPTGYCPHRRSELNSENRRVYCRDCEQEIPAFDVLKRLASEWESYVSRYREAVRRAKVAEGNLADLTRRERNAKARVRKATKEAPACSCDPVERDKAVRYSVGPWCSLCGGRR